MGAHDIFKAGNLAEALAAAKDEVKAQPGAAAPRALLSALFCFAGDFTRADQQLDTINDLDPSRAVGVSLLRHLVRAEQARRQCHIEGRVPEFLAPPSPDLRRRLAAWVLMREGKPGEAAEDLRRAEEDRPRAAGMRDGVPFDDFRDLDDATASFLDVLTANGKYYWVPFEILDAMEFSAPVDVWDLLWRRVTISVREGPQGEVYVPVLYFGSHAHSDDAVKLGRATDWQGGEASPVRGMGQRTFLAGDTDVTVLELGRVTFRGEN